MAAGEEFAHWLALVEGTSNPALIIPALNALATVASHRGELPEALNHLERALALSENPTTPRVDKLRLILNLMIAYMYIGRLDDSLACGEKAAALGVEREPSLSPIYWMNLSMLHYRRHDWVPMRHAAGKAYDRCRSAGATVESAKALTNRGIAHMELGALRLAARDLRNTLLLASQVPPVELAYTHVELGRLLFIQGEYQAALGEGREALAALLSSVALLNKEEVARVNWLFGEIFARSGIRNMALKCLNRAAAYYSQIGLRADWQRAMESIERVLVEPIRLGRRTVFGELQQLDFLTAVLDMTDDLESVEPYLRGHSERVASLALLLGESLQLPDLDLKTLHLAARLHDVGMVAVDAELLHRDGPLTESERRRVGLHTVIGEEMLRPYELPSLGIQAIRNHHEHFRGNGFPDGLRGEAIPLLARIIAVVDVYDALTSDRVYRPAMRHSQAVVELRAMAGRELDPVLVDRFLELHDV